MRSWRLAITCENRISYSDCEGEGDCWTETKGRRLKVGKVEGWTTVIWGGHHRGVLGHALLKISILGIWHLSVKLEPLSPKMASFYWFGVLKASKSTFEVCTLNILSPDQIWKFRETSQASASQTSAGQVSAGKLVGSPGIFKLDLGTRYLECKLQTYF